MPIEAPPTIEKSYYKINIIASLAKNPQHKCLVDDSLCSYLMIFVRNQFIIILVPIWGGVRLQ